MKKTGAIFILAIFLFAIIFPQISHAQELPKEKFEVVEEEKSPIKYEVVEKFDTFAKKEVTIPLEFQFISKNLFGIENKSSRVLFAVSISVWLIFLLIFTNMMALFSPFSKITSIVIGVLLSFITSVIGITTAISKSLINIGGYITFLSRWGSGAVLIVLIIFIGIGLIIAKTVRYAKKRKEIEKSKEEGIQVGTELGFLSAIRKMFGKTAD
ncbi:MAG: hypothetical protein Q7S27_03325 [Nanoarchaeota archaeon]|nr:hypothetical protein [Nanoarchaeota archaeon]